MGAHHHHEIAIKEEKFVFTSKLRNITFALMGLGVVGMAYGLMTDAHGFWANFLLGNWYFMGVAMAATLFVFVMSATNAAWSIGFKRIAEAMSGYMPVAFIGFLIILLSMAMHWNHLYHWTHPGIADQFLADGSANPEYDEIIAQKVAYLNIPFMAARAIIAFIAWILFIRAYRRNSIAEDLQGGLRYMKRNKTLAVAFLPIYAVTWAMASWDFIMSIDTHWYSTIFWMYHFAAAWVTGISIIAIAAILLKRAGYLQSINENHMHDIGKFMFAFSIFWTYIWLSQYLLIFYANIPEEAIYYQERFENYKVLFFVNLIINFVAPFLLLMTRGSKRNDSMMLIVAVILIIGKYIDLYQGIMPGAVGAHAQFGITEIGMFLGFIGLFVYVMARNLTKANLVPVKHPYIKEYATHEVF